MKKQVANVHLMQKMNRLKVLNYIRRHPDTSRPAIARKTGLSLASITNVTSHLLEIGFLVESGVERAERVGRKSTLLRFGSEAYSFVFIAIDDEKATIHITDLAGRIYDSVGLSVCNMTSEEIIRALNDASSEVFDRVGRSAILAVGITFSGMVLGGSRFVLSSSMKWMGFDIRRMFEEASSLPVFVENNSRLKAVWYAYANRQKGNVLFVDLHKGIGAVQVCDGAVNPYVLGEIGHTTVEKDGESCFCGNSGCLEAMCSLRRLKNLYKEYSGKENVSESEIARLYLLGDPFAVSAADNCAMYLGIGLANLVSLLNPETIVINTGDFKNCLPVIDTAVEQMKSRVHHSLVESVSVQLISVSDENIVCGGAIDMCDRIFDPESPYNPV